MTAEKYLERVRKIDAIIRNKIEDHGRWVEIAEGLGGFSVSEKVKSSRDLQQIPNAIARYIDIEREIEGYKKEREAIIKTIEQLPPIEYEIIYNFFVKEYPSTMKELAYRFGRSYDWVKKHKRRGVNIVQRILDSEEATPTR